MEDLWAKTGYILLISNTASIIILIDLVLFKAPIISSFILLFIFFLWLNFRFLRNNP